MTEDERFYLLVARSLCSAMFCEILLTVTKKWQTEPMCTFRCCAMVANHRASATGPIPLPAALARDLFGMNWPGALSGRPHTVLCSVMRCAHFVYKASHKKDWAILCVWPTLYVHCQANSQLGRRISGYLSDRVPVLAMKKPRREFASVFEGPQNVARNSGAELT